MSFLTLNTDNIHHEHICCAIGNDKENTQRAQTKKDWLRSRFEEGLTFRRLDIRGKVFIEYIPIEHVWKPLVGQNHLVINCLWVSGQFKGKGYAQKLLETCLNDANTRNMDGVAVVTSASVKPFLTDKKFYMKHGFEIADSAPPFFELLLHKTNPGSQSPSFADHVKTGSTHADKQGFTFVYAHQCPFMSDYAGKIYVELAQKHGFSAEAICLQNATEAQQWGSPFGTFGVWFNGMFQFHDLMPVAKFEKYLADVKNGK